ncbi:MAG: TonB-dependent receptor plug domain-containing protein, partial [Deltaproteobacteria bacterium]|nr:TonB-dependent receptor plug domain-containing protein [Deltaproteobacteria bacterium]
MRLGRAALLGAALAAAPSAAAPAEVRVAGDPLPGPASRDATAASSVVQGERLRSAGTSTAEVLARVPGVQITRTGSVSDLATAAIRGATAAETPVYLAGIRLNDDVTGVADLSTVPPHLLGRVEVYRGASPFDSDRAGLGGAILLEPRAPQSTELSAGAAVGSFGEQGAFVAGGAAGPRAASLVALRRDAATNDYSFRDERGQLARRGNADYTATDAWALGRLSLPGGGRLTTLAHAYDREQGTPGFVVVPDDRARTRTRLLLGGLSARLPCDSGASGERCSVEAVLTRLDSTAIVTD